METNNNGRKIVIGVIVLVVVALGSAWLLSRSGPVEEAPATAGRVFDQGVPGTAQADDLIVTDQFPGSVVFLSRVNLPEGGWVAIRKDENGQPGEVVGRKYFSVLDRVGSVVLTRAMEVGEKYFAVLYNDKGDRVFSEEADLVRRDVSGQVIAPSFTVTTEFYEEKG